MSRVMAILVFPCTLVTGISWSTAYTNLDVSDWTMAVMKGGIWSGPIAGIVISALMARLAFWMGRLIELPEQPVAALPSANLKPDDRAVWIGTARSMWALPLVFGFLVLGVFKLMRQINPLSIIMIMIAIVGVPFISIRISADSRGVLMSFGPIGWPRKFIPLKDISQARAVDVIPLQHRGYGYRGSMKLLGRVSIVLRGGEGLELALKGNKKLTVTVDGADEGAGLINDLIARAGKGID